jgi:hypothetical protein
LWAFSARKTHEDLAQGSLKQYGRPGALGAGPAGPGSRPLRGPDRTERSARAALAASQYRREQGALAGRGFPGGLRVDQACVLTGGLVEPLCVAERRVELALCISDGGLQQHAVAELQHIGEDPFLDLTDCGDIIVDPFLGSGSTLIAADKTGRVCRGVELDPLYVDVIVRRFEAATLVHELLEARDEKRLLRLQRQLAGYKLLIIDELGYVPLSQTGTELLFEIFSQGYERGSTGIVTSALFYLSNASGARRLR